METNKIYQGDALEVLKTFPDESINCVMTSPPYWALRDYGIKEQLGLEKTFDEYINKLCDIFDEIKRVLRDDGTCWVNIGDCYAGEMGKKNGWTDNKLGFEKEEAIKNGVCLTNKNKIKHQLPQKCLVQIPHRFAIEMTNRGWILRNTLIWYKPNCMPSSAKDRFTVDFEYLFFFVKNKKYFFETQYEPIAEISMKDKRKDKGRFEYNGKRRKFKEITLSKVPYAIQPRDKEFVEYRNLPNLEEFSKYLNEHRKILGLSIEKVEEIMNSQAPHHWFGAESYPSKEDYEKLKDILELGDIYDKQMTEIFEKSSEKTFALVPQSEMMGINSYGRNKRAVWRITTKPFKESHFAVFPEKLCETPLKAGCPEFVCNKCGNPKVLDVEYQREETRPGKESKYTDEVYVNSNVPQGLKKRVMAKQINKGYKPTCKCNAGFSGGIALDPFFGSGTLGLVALKQNKRFIGIELNPEYIKIAENRLKPYLEQRKL